METFRQPFDPSKLLLSSVAWLGVIPQIISVFSFDHSTQDIFALGVFTGFTVTFQLMYWLVTKDIKAVPDKSVGEDLDGKG